jgi:hypothetical protein
VLIAFDQFINVAVFGGLVGETISAHAGRLAVRNVWWAVRMCDALDLLESNHGSKACCGDLYRALLVVQAEESSGNLLTMAIRKAAK